MNSHTLDTALTVTQALKNIKRIGLAATTFGCFNKVLWYNQNIKQDTKISRFIRRWVIPTLLYGSETCVPNKADERKLDSFDAHCLRRIMKVWWWLFKWNEDIRRDVKHTPPSTKIMRNRLWRFGHLPWMERTWLPVLAYKNILKGSHRCWGRQKIKWIDKDHEGSGFIRIHKISARGTLQIGKVGKPRLLVSTGCGEVVFVYISPRYVLTLYVAVFV